MSPVKGIICCLFHTLLYIPKIQNIRKIICQRSAATNSSWFTCSKSVLVFGCFPDSVWCRTELLTTVVVTTKGWMKAKQALDSSASARGQSVFTVRTKQGQSSNSSSRRLRDILQGDCKVNLCWSITKLVSSSRVVARPVRLFTCHCRQGGGWAGPCWPPTLPSNTSHCNVLLAEN